MAYDWQQASAPTNLQMLSEGYSTRGLDDFKSNTYNTSMPEQGSRYGLTADQTVNAKLSHSEEATRKAKALDDAVGKEINNNASKIETMKTVYGGLKIGTSLAEMMTAKGGPNEFKKRAKKAAGTILTNPTVQDYARRGITAIVGETGAEAVGEESGELAELTAAEQAESFAGEASEALGEEVAADALGNASSQAIEAASDAFGNLDLAALQDMDIASIVAEDAAAAAAESASLASEIAGPVVSAIAKTGSALLGGADPGTAAASAAAGVGVGALTAAIPVAGPFLAPFTGAAASFGTRQALGEGKGSGKGFSGPRTGLARKYIGQPTAAQLLKGYG